MITKREIENHKGPIVSLLGVKLGRREVRVLGYPHSSGFYAIYAGAFNGPYSEVTTISKELLDDADFDLHKHLRGRFQQTRQADWPLAAVENAVSEIAGFLTSALKRQMKPCA